VVGLNCTLKLEVPPGAIVMGNCPAPAAEKDCPVRSICVILTDVELTLDSESVLVAVWPIDRVPKVIESGDATRGTASRLFTIAVPQPDRVMRRLKAIEISKQWRMC
jgi:hypothetical protein